MQTKILKFILFFIFLTFSSQAETLDNEIIIDNRIIPAKEDILLERNVQYFKFVVDGKCIRLRLIEGKGKKPSRLYLRHGYQREQLLYESSNITWRNRYSTLNSIRLLPLAKGGYSVFWMVYTQISDEVLYMDELDMYGNQVVHNRSYGSYNPGGTKPVVKLLRNQNYLVGYVDHGTTKIHLYDNNTGNSINQFPVHAGSPCKISKLEVMTTNNGGFLVVCEDVVKRFRSDGTAHPL